MDEFPFPLVETEIPVCSICISPFGVSLFLSLWLFVFRCTDIRPASAHYVGNTALYESQRSFADKHPVRGLFLCLNTDLVIEPLI
jgi:hypothetical protein